MSHRTMIGGTAYEISGGKTLINGTAYSIKNGKTLVGGTVYEVGFDNGMRTITLYRDFTGSGESELRIYTSDGNWVYRDNGVLLNVSTYDWSDWTSPVTIEVPIGTEISYSVTPDYYGVSYEVVLNGSTVESGYVPTKDSASYGYTVTQNVTLVMSGSYPYSLTITEE